MPSKEEMICLCFSSYPSEREYTLVYMPLCVRPCIWLCMCIIVLCMKFSADWGNKTIAEKWLNEVRTIHYIFVLFKSHFPALGRVATLWHMPVTFLVMSTEKLLINRNGEIHIWWTGTLLGTWAERNTEKQFDRQHVMNAFIYKFIIKCSHCYPNMPCQSVDLPLLYFHDIIRSQSEHQSQVIRLHSAFPEAYQSIYFH